MKAEMDNLSDFTNQFANGQYNAGSRKVMQSQSFSTRNSK
jgi:hypothetical protein